MYRFVRSTGRRIGLCLAVFLIALIGTMIMYISAASAETNASITSSPYQSVIKSHNDSVYVLQVSTSGIFFPKETAKLLCLEQGRITRVRNIDYIGAGYDFFIIDDKCMVIIHNYNLRSNLIQNMRIVTYELDRFIELSRFDIQFDHESKGHKYIGLNWASAYSNGIVEEVYKENGMDLIFLDYNGNEMELISIDSVDNVWTFEDFYMYESDVPKIVSYSTGRETIPNPDLHVKIRRSLEYLTTSDGYIIYGSGKELSCFCTIDNSEEFICEIYPYSKAFIDNNILYAFDQHGFLVKYQIGSGELHKTDLKIESDGYFVVVNNTIYLANTENRYSDHVDSITVINLDDISSGYDIELSGK